MANDSWIRISAIKARLDARTMNQIVASALGRRVESVTKRPPLRKAIGEEFVRAVNPLVPMKTGTLRESGRATDDGRVYWTAIGGKGENYASEMYDEQSIRWPNGYHRPTTSGTTPRWVEVFLADTSKYDAFVNSIIPIIVEEFNKDG